MTLVLVASASGRGQEAPPAPTVEPGHEGHGHGWWRPRLAASSAQERVAALEAIAAMRAYWDVGAVQALLEDPSVVVREQAVEVLGQLGPAGDDALVAAVASSQRVDVRRAAIAWLTEARSWQVELLPGVAERVFADAGAEDDELAEAALDALVPLTRAGRLPPEQVIDLFQAGLALPEARGVASEQLAQLGTPRAVAALVRGLAGAEPELRVACAFALARSRSEEARTARRASIIGDAPGHLVMAIALAGRTEEEPSIALALSRAIVAGDLEVDGQDVLEALAGVSRRGLRTGLDGRAGPLVVVLAQLVDDPGRREAAVRLLGRLGAQAAPCARRLATMLDRAGRDSDRDAAGQELWRMELLQALDGIGPDAAKDAGAAVLRRIAAAAPDSIERADAFGAAAGLGLVEAVDPALEAWARERDPGAARVLAVAGPPEGHPALLDALEDEASPGRAAAAVALARSGRAVPKLLAVVEGYLRARDDELAVQLGLDMAAALGPQAAPLLPALKRLGDRAQAIVDVLEPDRSTELRR